MSLRADAKLFVPGVGLVTPPKAKRADARDDDGDAHAMTVDDAQLSSGESLIALTSDDEHDAAEIDEQTLRDGVSDAARDAMRAWRDDVVGEADVKVALETFGAESATPLLKQSGSFNAAYGADEASAAYDESASSVPLLSPELERAYGAAEAHENSPQVVVELDAEDADASERRDEITGREASMFGSAAATPLLKPTVGVAAYGANANEAAPSDLMDVRAPLLPRVKESTYGAASPLRGKAAAAAAAAAAEVVTARKSKAKRKAQRVVELPPLKVTASVADIENKAAPTWTPEMRAPLLTPKSPSSPVANTATYGALDVEFTHDLRHVVDENDAPYALLDDEDEASDDFMMNDRDAEMADYEDDRAGMASEMNAPSAPPMPAHAQFSLPERVLADDLCCVAWTVARERLDLLQPLFRSKGASIGRITLSHLRTVMRKLEPERATARALDRLEAMLCACGYVEDISLSEFVHATHSGTLAATRLGTASGAHEAAILCAYMAELISRTPASAQTALMLGTRRHKAWLELPRLLAKTLEPEKLCLLVATLDLADDITSGGAFVDITIYVHWLRRTSETLRASNPLPTPPAIPKPPVPAAELPRQLSAQERLAAREKLVRLWEEREQRRRASASLTA